MSFTFALMYLRKVSCLEVYFIRNFSDFMNILSWLSLAMELALKESLQNPSFLLKSIASKPSPPPFLRKCVWRKSGASFFSNRQCSGRKHSQQERLECLNHDGKDLIEWSSDSTQKPTTYKICKERNSNDHGISFTFGFTYLKKVSHLEVYFIRSFSDFLNILSWLSLAIV